MAEQFTFDFLKSQGKEEGKLSPEEEVLRRLAVQYKEKVGIDPLVRLFDKKTIEQGIANPEAELARLRAIDLEEDQESRRRGNGG